MAPNKSTLCLLFLGTLSVTVAGPVTNKHQQCASTCTKNGKFQYEDGKRYLYNYETNVASSITGTTEDATYVRLSATVEIDVVSKCNMVMKLSKVALRQVDISNPEITTDAPNQETYRTELERHPLHFAFQDGRIESLCLNSDDESWVLNIKRGVLTVFQNSMQSFNTNEDVVETDVTGKCTSHYTVQNNGLQTIIQKEKDLLECENHVSHKGPIHAHSYMSSSSKKSVPLLKSSHVCQQVILDGKVTKAECSETHLFKPFSNNDAGATTYVNQKLQYTGEENSQGFSQLKSDNLRVVNMLFDFESEKTDRNEDQTKAEQLFRELCSSTQESVQSTTPTVFSAFVYELRELNSNQLKDMLNKIETLCPDNTQRRKLFMDGLQMTVTPASVSLMAEFIQKNEISETEANAWYLSLAFVQNPTSSMITELSQLLDGPDPKHKAMLGVSALIHTYCDSNENCYSESTIQQTLQKIKNTLNPDCKVTSEEDKTNKLVAIKALGNSGSALVSAKILTKCFNQKENPTEVRVAAMEALRRLPCSRKLSSAWNVYSELDEDSEVRIAAFKVVMQCPSPEIIEKIEDVLNREDTNQVGSYVWTYLTNVQESVDPCKREIRKLLYSHNLKQKFSTDIRKFSQAFEGSLHSETMNMGIHADADIIFSPKSYLPRSGLLNITVDMFDKTVNLFEIGGRIEGFERFVESLVGSNGIYPEPKVEGLLRSIRERYEIDSNKLDDIDKKYQNNGNSEKLPRASMYLRIFGNDLHYSSFEGNQKEGSFGLMDFLHQLVKKDEVNLSKNVVFLDTSISIPTTAGLPLILAVNGSASLRIEMKGHLDLKKILSGDCNITTHFKPSAAIKVSGTMAVDTFLMKSGIKMESTMHTSTAIASKIILRGKKLIDVQIDAPKDKMELFDVSSELFLLKGNKMHPIKGVEDNKVEMKDCSGEFASKMFGVEICTEMVYPNTSPTDRAPFFPLSGPAKASVILKKTDQLLTYYQFGYRQQNIEDDQVFARHFIINTPGSSVDRELSGDLVLDLNNHKLKAQIITPWKKFNLEGNLQNTETSISVDASITVDKKEIIAMHLATSISKKSEHSVQFTHLLNIQLPDRPFVTLNGSTTVQSKIMEEPYNSRSPLIAVEYSLQHLTTSPITFSGSIRRGVRSEYYSSFILNLAMQSPVVQGSFRGSVQKERDTITSRFRLYYMIREQLAQSYELIFRNQHVKSSNIISLKGNVEFKGTSLEPLVATWEHYHQENYLKNYVDFSRGKGRNKKTALLSQMFTYENKDDIHNYTAQIMAKCTMCKTKDSQLYFSHQHSSQMMNTKAILEYSYGNQLQKFMNQKYPFIKNIPSTARVEFYATLKLTKDNYEGFITLVPQDGQRYHALLHYHYSEENANKYYSGNLQIETPFMSPITVSVNAQIGSHFSLKSAVEFNKQRLSLDTSYAVSDKNHKITIVFEPFDHHFSSELLFNAEDKNVNIILTLGGDDNWKVQGKVKFIHNGNKYENFVGVQWDTFAASTREIYFSCDFIKIDKGYDLKIRGKIFTLKFDLMFSTKTDGTLYSPSFNHSTGFKFQLNDNKVFAFALDINSLLHNLKYELYTRLSVSLPTINKKYVVTISLKKDNQDWDFVGTYHEDDNEIVRILQLLQLETLNPHSNSHTRFDLQLLIAKKHPLQFLIDYQRVVNEIKMNSELQWFSGKKTRLSLYGNAFSQSSVYNVIGNVNLTIADDIQYTGDIEFICMKDNIKIESNIGKDDSVLMFSGEINNNNKDGMIADFHLTTPWQIKEIKATARYNFDGSNLSTFAEVMWSPENRIVLEVVGSFQSSFNREIFVGTIQCSAGTSTKPTIDILLTLTHDNYIDQLKDNFEIKWGGKEVMIFKLDVAQISSTEFRSTVVLACPIILHHPLELKLSFSQRDQLHVVLEIASENEKVLIDINGTNEVQGSKRIVYVAGKVETPWKRLSKLHIILHEMIHENQVDGKVHILTDNLSYTLLHSGFYEDIHNFGYNITFTTSNQQKYALSIQQKITFSPRKFNMIHESSILLHPDKNYGFRLETSMNFFKGIEIESELKIFIPQKIYSLIHTKISIKNIPPTDYVYCYVKIGNSTFSVEYQLSPNDQLNGQGFIRSILTSSVSGFEHISFTSKYALGNKAWSIESEVKKNSEVLIQIDVSSNSIPTQGKVNVRSPNLFSKKVDVSVEYDFSSSSKKSFSLKATVNDKAISFETIINLELGQLHLLLLTPYRDYGKMAITVQVEVTEIKKMVNVVLEKNNERIQLDGKLTVGRNRLDFNGLIKTPYYRYKKLSSNIIIDFNFQSDECLKFIIESETLKIELKGTIHAMDQHNEQFALTLISEYFNINTGIKINSNYESQLYTIDTDIYYNEKSVKTESSYFVDKNELMIKATTPWENYKTLLVKLEGSYGGGMYKGYVMWDINSKKKELKIEIGQKDTLLELSFSILHFDQPVVIIFATSVLSGQERTLDVLMQVHNQKAKLSAKYINEHLHKQFEVYFKSNFTLDHKFEAKGFMYVSPNKKSGEATLSIMSSLLNYRKYAVEGSFQTENKEIHVKITGDKKLYELNGKVDVNKDIVLLSINISTPIQGWENINTKVEWNKENSLKVILTLSEGTIELNGLLRIEDMKSKMQLSAQTPYKGYEHLTVTGEHDFTNSEKTATIKMESGPSNIQLKGSAIFSEEGWKVSLIMSSTYENYEELKLDGLYIISLYNTKGKFFVQHGDRQSELTFSVTNQPHQNEMNFQFASPYKHFEFLGMSHSSKIEAKEKSVITSVWWATDKKITYKSKTEYVPSGLNSRINIMTPFSGFEITVLTLQYQFVPEIKYAQIALHSNGAKLAEIKLNIKRLPENNIIKLDVYPPINGYQSLQMTTKPCNSNAENDDITETNVNKIAKQSSASNHEDSSWICLDQMNVEIMLESTTDKSIFIGVKYNVAHRTLSHGMFSFQKGLDKINIVILNDLSSMEKKFHLTSTYEHFEEFSIQWKYNIFYGEKREIIFSTSWNNEKVELTSFLSRPKADLLNAEIHFRSPFKQVQILDAVIKMDFKSHHKELTAMLNYNEEQYGGSMIIRTDDNSDEPTFSTTIRWGETGKVTLNLIRKLKDKLADFKFILTTPIKSCEINNITFSYNYRDIRNSFVSFTSKLCSSNSEMSASIQSDSTKTSAKIIGKNLFIIPSIGITFNYNYDSVHKMKLEFHWDNKYTAAVHGFLKTKNDISMQIQITSSYHKFQNFKLTFDYITSQPKKVIKILVKPPKVKSLQLLLEAKADYQSVGFNLSLQTPFQKVMEFSMRGTNFFTKEGSEGLFVTGLNNKVPFKLEWNVKKENIRISMHSPFEQLTRAKFSASLNSLNKNILSNVNFEWNDNHKIETSLDLKYDLPSIFSMNIDIKTTLSSFRKMNFLIMHSSNNGITNNEVSLTTPFKHFEKASGKLYMKSSTDGAEFNLMMESMMKNFNVAGKLIQSLPNDLQGNLTLMTNFFAFPTTSISVSFKNSEWKKVNAYLNLTSNKNSHSFVISHIVEDGRAYDELRIESPYLENNPITIESTTSFNSSNIGFLANIFLNDLYNFEADLSYNHENIQGFMKIKSKALKDKEIILTVNVNRNSKQRIAKFSYASKSTSHEMIGILYNDNGIHGSLQFNSDILGIKSITFNLLPNKSYFSGDIAIDTFSAIHKLSLNANWTTTTATGKIVLETPWKKINKFTFKGSIQNGDHTGELYFSIHTAHSIHIFNTSFITDEHSVVFHFSAESPLIKSKFIHFSLQFPTKNLLNSRTVISLKTMYSSHAIIISHFSENEAREGQVEIITPLFNINKLIIRIVYMNFENKDLELIFTVDVHNQTHSLRGEIHMHPSSIRANALIESFTLPIHKMAMGFHIESIKNNAIKFNTQISVGANKHELICIINWKQHTYNLEIELQSTLLSQNVIKGYVNYVNNEKIELILDLGKKIHKFSLQLYNKKLPVIHVELLLETPSFKIGFLNTGIKIDLGREGFWDNSIQAYMKTPQSVKNLLLSTSEQDDVKGIKIKLESPNSELLMINFGFSQKNQNGYIQLSWGEQRLNLNGSFHSSKDQLLKFTFNGQLFYNRILHEVNMTADCNYERNSGIFNAKFQTVAYFTNNHPLTIQLMYKPDDMNHEITINIQTPYVKYETINLFGKISYDKMLTEITSDFSVAIPSSKYSVNGEVKRNNYDVLIAITLNENNRLVRKIEMLLKLDRMNYKFQIKLSTPWEEYFDTSLSFKMNEDSLNLNAQLKLYRSFCSLDLIIVPKNLAIQLESEKELPSTYSPNYGIQLVLKDQSGQVFSGSILYYINKNNMIFNVEGKCNDQLYSLTLKFSGISLINENLSESNQELTSVRNKTFAIELKLGNILMKGSITVGDGDVLFKMNSSFMRLTTLHLSLKNGLLVDANFNQNIFKLQWVKGQEGHYFEITIFDRSIKITTGWRTYYDETNKEDVAVFKSVILLESSNVKFAPINFELIQRSTKNQEGLELHLQNDENEIQVGIINSYTQTGITYKGEILWKAGQTKQEVSFESTFNWYPNTDLSFKLNLLSRRLEFTTQINQTDGLIIDSTFKWDALRDSNKFLRMKWTFQRVSTNTNRIELLLHHPKLETDLIIKGHMIFDEKPTIFSSHFNIKYSSEENSDFKLGIKIMNDSNHQIFTVDATVLHSPSNLNGHFILELINNAEEKSIKISLYSISENNATFEISGKIIKQQQEVVIQIKSDDTQMKITTKAVSYSDKTNALMIIRLNKNPPATVRLQLIKNPPQLLMNIVYNTVTQGQIILSTGMSSEKEIRFQLLKGDHLQQQSLMHLLITLENSRLLKTSYSWNPEIFLQTLDDIKNMNLLLPEVSSTLRKLRNESIKLKNIVAFSFGTFFTFVLDDIYDFTTEVETICKDFYLALRNDKMINHFVIPFVKDAYERLQISKIITAIYYTIPVNQIEFIYFKLSSIWLTIKSSVDQILESAYLFIQDSTQDGYKMMYNLRRKVVRSVIEYVRAIGIKALPTITDLGYKVIGWISNYIFLTTNYISEIVINESIGGIFERYFDQIMNYCTKTYDTIILNYPYLKPAFSFAKIVYVKVETLILDESIQSHMKRFCNSIQNELFNLAYDILIEHPIIKLNTSYEILWDSDNNRVDYIQYLPVEWTNFYEFPRILDSLELKSFLEWKNSILYRIQNTPIKRIVKRNIPDVNFYPTPLKARAMLAGDQHYMTFDRKFFEFFGHCSYLLVRDIVDKTFTAIVKYEEHFKKTMKTFLFEIGNDNIEFNIFYELRVNGESKEYPVETNNWNIRRDGNLVVLNTASGIAVKCNFYYDVCEIELPHSYFGKTAGLFGTYDNEIKNDFLTSDQKVSKDINEFAESWAIGTSCNTNNKATEVGEDLLSQTTVCSHFFQSSESPLQRCFSKVSTDSFMRMCVNDLGSNDYKTADMACTAITAYISECKHHSITLTTPRECLKCLAPNVIFDDGITLFNDIPQSADIVLIIEEKSCNKNLKWLESLIAEINSKLIVSGIKNNNFALIGFGGNGIHNAPHIHTSSYHIFGNLEDISEFTIPTFTVGNGNARLAPAIEMAADLSFRTAVSKTIIALPCSGSGEMNTDEHEVIQHKLKRQGIVLHVLSNQEFQTSSKGKNNLILGIDNNFAYMPKMVMDSKHLLTKIPVTNPGPANLALNSNGSIFNKQRMNSTKNKLIKLELEVFAKRIAKTAVPAKCQKCQCLVNETGQTISTCKPCNSN